MDKKLNELKESNPLEYNTRMFDGSKNTVMMLIDSLKSKKAVARVLQALMVFPLSDYKTDQEGNVITDKSGMPVQKLGLVSNEEKNVFDFCLKMLDYKAQVIKLGIEKMTKQGEENVTKLD